MSAMQQDTSSGLNDEYNSQMQLCSLTAKLGNCPQRRPSRSAIQKDILSEKLMDPQLCSAFCLQHQAVSAAFKYII